MLCIIVLFFIFWGRLFPLAYYTLLREFLVTSRQRHCSLSKSDAKSSIIVISWTLVSVALSIFSCHNFIAIKVSWPCPLTVISFSVKVIDLSRILIVMSRPYWSLIFILHVIQSERSITTTHLPWLHISHVSIKSSISHIMLLWLWN